MAKTKAADAPKKKKKSAAAKGASLKAATKGGKNKGKSKSDGKGFETLMKLADHPLVADLLAVGAMAAVAAIAEQGFSGKSKGKTSGSSKAVKDAGKAAAAAIGKRLITEFEEVKKVSKPAPKA
jgi:hypothetical protein